MVARDESQVWTSGCYVAHGSSYWQEKEPETSSLVCAILVWKPFGSKNVNLDFLFHFLTVFHWYFLHYLQLGTSVYVGSTVTLEMNKECVLGEMNM